MKTLSKTLTMTTVAVLVAALIGVWLAMASPANSGAEQAIPSIDVDVRLGLAELDLCAGQTWPHFNEGCAAWIAATSDTVGIDRTISIAEHDVEHGFTVVGKAQPITLANR